MLLPFLLAAAAAGPPESGTGALENQVLEIFQRRCVSCHGEEKQSGKLRLDGFDRLLQGSKSGPVIVPGKSGDSLLVELVEGKGKKVMPPPKDGAPLKAEEVKLIRAWIDGGARRPGRPGEPAGDPAGPRAGERARSEATGGTPAETVQAEAARASEPVHAPVAALAFSPDGRLLLKGGFRSAEILDGATGEPRARIEELPDLVRAAAFAPEGGLLALAGGVPGRSGEVKVFEVSGEPAAPRIDLKGTIAGHGDAIYAVAFARDGKRIATSSYDKLAKVWEVASGEEVFTLRDHIDAVFALAFEPDPPSPASGSKAGTRGARLATCAADRTVKIWDATSGVRLYTLSDATDGLHALAFHPTGGLLAAAGGDKMLRVWKLGPAGGELVRSGFAHRGAILKLLYSPDGRKIYTAGEDRLVKAWDSTALREELVFEPQSDWPLALALSPDGERLAVGRYDGSWSIYDARTARTLAGSPERAPAQASPGKPGEAPRRDSRPVQVQRDELQVAVVDGGNVTVPPSLSSLSVRGGSLGRTVEATLEGANLAGAEVISGGKGIAVQVLANEALPRPEFRRTRGATGAEIVDHSIPHRLKVKIAIAPEASPGLHTILARTPLGATNGISFQVDALPEVSEKEPNDPPAALEEIAPGSVVSGKMDRSGDVDSFRFQASAGQDLVFDVVASAIGSALNGLLTLHDAEGKELASSATFAPGRADARLAFRFQNAGAYSVRLTDRDFRAGPAYRLRVGEFPLVTEVFPLGLQRGTEAEFRVQGFNLGGMQSFKIAAPADAAPRSRIPVPIPDEVIARHGPALEGGRVSVGDAPEVQESEESGLGANEAPEGAQRVPPRFTANGSIGRGRGDPRGPDVDHYRFSARKGETLLVEIEAQRLGSPLDPFIDVLDAAGRPIERAVLRPVAKSYITLADRDARTIGLRVDSWADLRLNDYVLVGNEVLRVRGLPDYPDEDVIFFPRGGVRRGYFDTTPSFHAVNDSIYKVEVHPPGTSFPPNGMPIFHLYHRNDDGGHLYGRDSVVHFEVPEDGEYLVRVADVLGAGGPGHSYRLTVREPRPDFKFSVDPSNLNVPAGGLVPLSARVERIDDFEGEVGVEVEGLPSGFRAFTASILPGEESSTLCIEALPEAKSTAADFSFRVIARARIAGQEVVREARGGMITVVPPGDIALSSEPRELELSPGGRVKVTVRVERRNGFRARVPLDALNLPHGVYVMDTGLNGILITEKEAERSYLIYAEPWVEPFTRTFFSIGTVETRSSVPSRHAAPPQVLRLKTTKSRLASF